MTCVRSGDTCHPTEYRQSVDDNGIRQYDAPLLNTDQTIFDPRVWNEEVKEYFVNVVLKNVRPKVVLISAVSPAHRYAIDIARTVREHLPDCLIILGGRHADETIGLILIPRSCSLQPSSTLTKIMDGSIEPVIDFILSGEGYYALDVLMKAISLAMDIPTKTVDVASVLDVLSDFSPLLGPVPGQAIIAAPRPDTIALLAHYAVQDRSERPAFPVQSLCHPRPLPHLRNGRAYLAHSAFYGNQCLPVSLFLLLRGRQCGWQFQLLQRCQPRAGD